MRETHPSNSGSKHTSATNDSGMTTDQMIDRHREKTH
jgi:hypothetical protein